jgi:hypothetical protein
MHQKFAKDGFEVISVVTDAAKDTKSVERARTFLRDKLKVPFPNAHVDATTFDYENKISGEGVPAVFVFNHENKWVQKYPTLSPDGSKILQEVDYDVIEKQVADLIQRK